MCALKMIGNVDKKRERKQRCAWKERQEGKRGRRKEGRKERNGDRKNSSDTPFEKWTGKTFYRRA